MSVKQENVKWVDVRNSLGTPESLHSLPSTRRRASTDNLSSTGPPRHRIPSRRLNTYCTRMGRRPLQARLPRRRLATTLSIPHTPTTGAGPHRSDHFCARHRLCLRLEAHQTMCGRRPSRMFPGHREERIPPDTPARVPSMDSDDNHMVHLPIRRVRSRESG
jgi:hypothetical protein